MRREHETDMPVDEEATSAFLLDLARALHLAYQPSLLVEARVRRAAKAWGLQVEVFTLQSLAMTEVVSAGRPRVAFARLPFNPHWNLGRAAALLRLSDRIAQGGVRLPEARAELDRIVATHSPYPEWLVFLAYGVYGAAVAARVGGAWLEMGVAFVVGVLAGVIHYGTLRSQRLDLQKSFVAAFVGTLVAFGFTLVLPSSDALRALFGGVTLLVPAMVVTLGSLELATESVEAGLPRLTYGLLRFLMMGVGITAAGTLWEFFLPLPPHFAAQALPPLVTLVLVGIGGVALTVCMSGRPRDVGWIVCGVLIAYATQAAAKAVLGDKGSPLVSAFVLGVAGLLYGRGKDRMPMTVIMPGLLQLAPGFVGTQALVALLGAGGAGAKARLFDVLLVALQLVLGLVFATVVVPPRFSVDREDPVPPRAGSA
ncbi:threonine/serine exporter family protein [Corallococcus sp. bb12-1]|uniref:threonine/serine ThrE exporter family protein n=1 Tax=Corallococcus sp. bb12-1 TaxID=2996784 RepID=UPI00226D67B9|nr:threonine/serine exporter family protein [Corallococcus sp. bb12-1]MCY1047112.1 threonine/serine exporter family protein [Corallococcus sp. bb12-1]